MGKLIEGQWHDVWYDTASTGGKFKRKASQFREYISAEKNAKFPAEANRYHLYVSLACPWAHRTLIMRELKQLTDLISLSIVDPLMEKNGWVFSNGPGCIPDQVNHCKFLYQIYTKAQPDYTGRVTVPVLWDKQKNTIVNNESAEIIRIFNSAFNHLTNNTLDFYPTALQKEIDEVNNFVYHKINNGVYKCGFATTQSAYTEAFTQLFSALDEVEKRLSQQRYLVGAHITEADWRLFTTLIRFDAVYYSHFKCNQQRISDYHHIFNYLLELYQVPGIASTVNFDHIKQHYYRSHVSINPTQIVPIGPKQDFTQAHDRHTLTA
jgi:putative glutathione S-transferase